MLSRISVKSEAPMLLKSIRPIRAAVRAMSFVTRIEASRARIEARLVDVDGRHVDDLLSAGGNAAPLVGRFQRSPISTHRRLAGRIETSGSPVNSMTPGVAAVTSNATLCNLASLSQPDVHRARVW